MGDHLLSVRRLSIGFEAVPDTTRVTDRVTFDVGRGECVALVGESGSGKTVTALAVLRLLPPNARLLEGQVLLAGHDVWRSSERLLSSLRGRVAALLPQDPIGALNPVFTVGSQIAGAVRLLRGERRRRAQAIAEELLEQAGLDEPHRVMCSYPQELSGGMQQRSGLALALSGEPALLIADEPTTALDATAQAEVAASILRIQQQRSMGLLLITHDVGLVSRMADSIVVMYAGRVVESGGRDDVLATPTHPYTQGLLASQTGKLPADGYLSAIHGAMPPVAEWGPGCRFAPRCALAVSSCIEQMPQAVERSPGHVVMCPLAAGIGRSCGA